MTKNATTADLGIIPLSQLSNDPALRAFFDRGEHFSGDQFALPAPRKPDLKTGAAVQAPARAVEFA